MQYLVKGARVSFLFLFVLGCTHFKKKQNFEVPKSTAMDLNESKLLPLDLSDPSLPLPSHVLVFIILLILVTFFTYVSWRISKK